MPDKTRIMEYKWKRGYLLGTSNVRNWSDEAKAIADMEEKKHIFSGFTPSNQGRSRIRVCTLNESHLSYDTNARLIEAAPEMASLLADIILFGATEEYIKRAQRIIKSISGPDAR